MTNKEILTRLESIDGHVGFYYKSLVTGETLQYHADEAFSAASIIKLPLAVAAEIRFAKGDINPMTEVVITEAEKVGGCGYLPLIPGDVCVSIRGLCNVMIALSDNTATNKMIRLLSLKGIEERFNEMGLNGTRINRLLFDREAKSRGVENYFVLSEIMMLLEYLYHGEKYGKDISDAVISILKRQQVDHKIPGRICGRAEIANKTGEDENTTHDVGIVFADRPFLIGFASNNVDVYEMEDAIRNISYYLFLRNSDV